MRSLLCGRGSERMPSRAPGGGVFLSPWCVVHNLHHLLVGPGCLRSPWGGVVRTFSQDHSDGHPLVAMPLTEPSLPPPPRGGVVFAMAFHGNHYKTNERLTRNVQSG